MNNSEYWYPWYPTIFKSNTLHLTPEHDGLYRRLIDHYMETREPLPDNDPALARICGVDIECFKHASSIIKAFFKQEDGLLKHDFCNRILDDQDKRSHKRTLIAEKAAKKRWSQVAESKKKNASSMLNAMHGDATGQDRTLQDKKDICSPPDGFSDFWALFPKERAGSKDKAKQAYAKALTRATKEQIKNGVEAYRTSSEVTRGFAKGAAAWLNDDRWTSKYAPDPEIKKAVTKQRDQTEAMKILRGEI